MFQQIPKRKQFLHMINKQMYNFVYYKLNMILPFKKKCKCSIYCSSRVGACKDKWKIGIFVGLLFLVLNSKFFMGNRKVLDFRSLFQRGERKQLLSIDLAGTRVQHLLVSISSLYWSWQFSFFFHKCFPVINTHIYCNHTKKNRILFRDASCSSSRLHV